MNDQLHPPADFDDAEPIVRVLRAPHFFKNGKITPGAFRPQREKTRVSVIRWLDRDHPDSETKGRCQGIGNTGTNQYCGVALMLASDFREVGLALEYTPVYPGHSDAIFPFASPKDEPHDGELFAKQSEIAHELIRRASCVVDPLPQDPNWTIPEDELRLTRRCDG